MQSQGKVGLVENANNKFFIIEDLANQILMRKFILAVGKYFLGKEKMSLSSTIDIILW
jgi:hypothetical protein